jgi:hypothetical protein
MFAHRVEKLPADTDAQLESLYGCFWLSLPLTDISVHLCSAYVRLSWGNTVAGVKISVHSSS